MDRRRALEVLGSLAASGLLPSCGRGAPSPSADSGRSPGDRPPASQSAMPAIFLAHGSPLLLDDARWVAELAQWAQSIPRPRAVLMISAHWLDRPVTLGATRTVPLVHDFSGFPRRHYEVTYPAPGAPALAQRVRELLGESRVLPDETRGLDHGAYVPLLAMYPAHDVPVLQISMPTLDPVELLALGRTLAPLRKEGVLLVGSGFLTHNLRTLDGRGGGAPSWAVEFDQWTAEALLGRDMDALVRYRERAPGVTMALPTHEHFAPVLVAAGASVDHAEDVTFPIQGFTYGSFTRRSVQFG